MRAVLILLLPLVWCLPAWAGEWEADLAVPGIACRSCAGDVDAALLRVGGVSKVTIDLTKRQVRVTFDGHRATVADLIDALDAVGFDSRPIAGGERARPAGMP